ncbi:MAG: alpha/beta fold hydrolase [Nocardioidaceae bacterium]
MSATAAYLAPQLAHFATRHRTVAVDLRGHGESDAPEQDYTIEGFASDVAWMSQQLGLERPVVVGHSLGGIVALHWPRLVPSS